MPGSSHVLTATVCAVVLNISTAFAAQEVAPPEAQAWIDIATFSGMGMPIGGMSGMGAVGGMFGGQGGRRGAGGNSFGNTRI